MFLIIIINNINDLCIIILILQVLLFQYNKKNICRQKYNNIFFNYVPTNWNISYQNK